MVCSNENLLEKADVESHINFINSLLEKYNWKNDIKEKIYSTLEFIDKKKNDKVLHLSIVGEFSCGKSTFINALLQDNLLAAGIIQGTTVASTIIKCAEEYAVIVNYKDGSQYILNKDNIWKKNFWLFMKTLLKKIKLINAPNMLRNSIRDYVIELTTNEKLAETIKEVIIEHPATALQNGISIIDMPGTDSLVRWHEDVARTAIRDISDVSIILTNADKPLPDSLNNFVKQNLDDILQHCIFVVTKMDLIREKERKRQLDYVRNKAESTFDIKNPLVLPYSPKFVLGEADSEIKKEIQYNKTDYADLIQQSYLTEALIYEALKERRIVIQVQKMLNIMTNMLSYILSDMKRIFDELKQIHATLEEATKRNLKNFTEEMESKCCNSFQRNIENIKLQIVNSTLSAVDAEKKNIELEFNKYKTSCSKLNNFNKKLLQLLSNSSLTVKAVSSKYYIDIEKESYNQINFFWKEFKKHYNEFEALAIKKVPNFNMNEIEAFKQQHSQGAITNAINELSSYRKKCILGCMLISIIISVVIIAITGTPELITITPFIFLVAYVITNKFSKKKSEDYKEKIWSNVLIFTNSYFKDFISAIEIKMNDYVMKVDKYIREQISDCLKTYKKLVDDKIQEDNEKKQCLKQNISSLEQDVSEVKIRQQKIKSFCDKYEEHYNKLSPEQQLSQTVYERKIPSYSLHNDEEINFALLIMYILVIIGIILFFI